MNSHDVERGQECWRAAIWLPHSFKSKRTKGKIRWDLFLVVIKQKLLFINLLDWDTWRCINSNHISEKLKPSWYTSLRFLSEDSKKNSAKLRELLHGIARLLGIMLVQVNNLIFHVNFCSWEKRLKSWNQTEVIQGPIQISREKRRQRKQLKK